MCTVHVPEHTPGSRAALTVHTKSLLLHAVKHVLSNLLILTLSSIDGVIIFHFLPVT